MHLALEVSPKKAALNTCVNHTHTQATQAPHPERPFNSSERKQTRIFKGEPAFFFFSLKERKKQQKRKEKKKIKRRKKHEGKKKKQKKVILNYTETFVTPPSTDKIRMHSETTRSLTAGSEDEEKNSISSHTRTHTHRKSHTRTDRQTYVCRRPPPPRPGPPEPPGARGGRSGEPKVTARSGGAAPREGRDAARRPQRPPRAQPAAAFYLSRRGARRRRPRRRAAQGGRGRAEATTSFSSSFLLLLLLLRTLCLCVCSPPASQRRRLLLSSLPSSPAAAPGSAPAARRGAGGKQGTPAAAWENGADSGRAPHPRPRPPPPPPPRRAAGSAWQVGGGAAGAELRPRRPHARLCSIPMEHAGMCMYIHAYTSQTVCVGGVSTRMPVPA